MILSIHISLLFIFVLVTSALMLVAVVDRLRTRPVRLMWYSPETWKVYGWPALFLSIVVGIVAYAGIALNNAYLYLGLGYLAGGMCWFVALRLSSATVVTDLAIMRNTRQVNNVLCWCQVIDFFVRADEGTYTYVFLYFDKEDRRARFEVRVPAAYRHVFKRMVYQHIEKKRMATPEHVYG